MNQNVGYQIKGAANLIFLIAAIVSVVCGAVLWINLKGFLGFVLGVGCASFGIIPAWISSLIMTGLGEIVINSARTASDTKELLTYTYNIFLATSKEEVPKLRDIPRQVKSSPIDRELSPPTPRPTSKTPILPQGDSVDYSSL